MSIYPFLKENKNKLKIGVINKNSKYSQLYSYIKVLRCKCQGGEFVCNEIVGNRTAKI